MEPFKNTRVANLRQTLVALGLSPARGLKKRELYDLLKGVLDGDQMTAMESSSSRLPASMTSKSSGKDDTNRQAFETKESTASSAHETPRATDSDTKTASPKASGSPEQHRAVTLIQAVWRGRFVRRVLRMRGNAAFDRQLCSNEVDPITMEPLKDIPLKQFFSYRDVDGHYYGFHIESAVQCWTKCNSRNPFTRQLLPKPVVDAIQNCHRLITPPSNRTPTTAEEWAAYHREGEEEQAAWERKWRDAHVPTKAFQVFHDFYLFSGFHIEESWFLELGVQKLSHFYSYLETLCFKLDEDTAQELSCRATLYGLVQSHKETHETYFRRDWSDRELEATQKDILFTLEEWVQLFKDPAEKTSLVMIILKALAVCSREAKKALPIFAPAQREEARPGGFRFSQETWLRMAREIHEHVPYELARYGITRAHLDRDREMRRSGYL